MTIPIYFYFSDSTVAFRDRAPEYRCRNMDSQCEFDTTQWTAILVAVDKGAEGSQAALRNLCDVYWRPIYSYARRSGLSPEKAKDLTQDFFVHILEKGISMRSGPDGGRFRSFLIRCFKNFCASAHRRAIAVKRGGRFEISSIDELDAENWESLDSDQVLTPEQHFEKRWAQTLLRRVIGRLEREHALIGASERFKALSSCLMADPGEGQYQRIADELNIAVSSVRTAVYRMRVNFAKLLRDEVQRLVQDPADTDDEIRYILTLLS